MLVMVEILRVRRPRECVDGGEQFPGDTYGLSRADDLRETAGSPQ